jgi:hypothetical protein
MKDYLLIFIVVFCILNLGALLSILIRDEPKQSTCQSEFSQQVKSTSIEHGQDIPHKGKRPNRIVIECEDK